MMGFWKVRLDLNLFWSCAIVAATDRTTFSGHRGIFWSTGIEGTTMEKSSK